MRCRKRSDPPEAEHGIGVPGAGGRGEWDVLFCDYRVSAAQDEGSPGLLCNNVHAVSNTVSCI